MYAWLKALKQVDLKKIMNECLGATERLTRFIGKLDHSDPKMTKS